VIQEGVVELPGKKRRLVVPVVLAVSIAGAVAGSGCTSDKPKPDAGVVRDATPDTPIV